MASEQVGYHYLIPSLRKIVYRDGFFNPSSPAVAAFAPGRLDVMGGIADYTGATVCEMPLALGTAVTLQKRGDRQVVVRSYLSDGKYKQVAFNLDDFYGSGSLVPAESIREKLVREDRWALYLAGAFWVLARQRHLSPRALGASIACMSDLPAGAGLSSSAALENATLMAISHAYRLSIDAPEAAVLAQKIENQVVGAACGIMDQMASMLGNADRLMLLKCQPHELIGHQKLPAALRLVGIFSGVKHSVADGGYRKTRVAAFMAHAIIAHYGRLLGAQRDIFGGYLGNVSRRDYLRYLRRLLPVEMSGGQFIQRYGKTIDSATHVDPATIYRVRAAGDHHVLEAHRVNQFISRLKKETGQEDAGNFTRLGRLMLASHASYGHRAMLGAQETDWIVRRLLKFGPQRGFYGAKITGGGQGGTVAVLCDQRASVTADLQFAADEYADEFGHPWLIVEGSGPGAAELGTFAITSTQEQAAGTIFGDAAAEIP